MESTGQIQFDGNIGKKFVLSKPMADENNSYGIEITNLQVIVAFLLKQLAFLFCLESEYTNPDASFKNRGKNALLFIVRVLFGYINRWKFTENNDKSKGEIADAGEYLGFIHPLEVPLLY